MDAIRIFTIGFTQKTARAFFELLKTSGVKRIVDVRLNNVSQLAGFAKRDDLKYFAEEICRIDYVHEPALAPTQGLLDEYKKQGGDWATYEARFLELIAQRRIEDTISKDLMNGACLLCSEAQPHHCHRRLVAEFLQQRWGGDSTIAVTHLT